MGRILPASLAGLALLCLGACERREAAQTSIPPPSKLAADASDTGMLAAAEPFRALARVAFTAKRPSLDRDIARAVAIAQHVKPALPPDGQRELRTQLDAIAGAQSIDNRAGIAWAAVEIYRLFVSHAPPTIVPQEVNLLRYACLRYEADLKARPVNWDDMVDAAEFGHRTWAAVQGHVSDASLREGMSRALADLADAARRRDPALALDADRRALELTSSLETHLAATRH